MVEVENIINQFNPISLNELDCVKLLDRVDTKYVCSIFKLSDILYIEGLQEYVKIVIKDEKPVLTLMSLKSLEEKLATDRFMRVHRSFNVNLNEVQTIERSRIIFGKTYIPVSDQYKDKFQEFLGKNLFNISVSFFNHFLTFMCIEYQ